MIEHDLKVETQLEVAKPMADVFEAIVNPAQMACYFISSGSDRLDTGQPVTWLWSDHDNAQLTITPLEIANDHKVAFLWSASGVETHVTIDLREESGGTIVKVCEIGWPLDAEGAARCLVQMQGWMHMLCCLKGYLEFEINLRTGSGDPATG